MVHSDGQCIGFNQTSLLHLTDASNASRILSSGFSEADMVSGQYGVGVYLIGGTNCYDVAKRKASNQLLNRIVVTDIDCNTIFSFANRKMSKAFNTTYQDALANLENSGKFFLQSTLLRTILGRFRDNANFGFHFDAVFGPCLKRPPEFSPKDVSEAFEICVSNLNVNLKPQQVITI